MNLENGELLSFREPMRQENNENNVKLSDV